MKKIIFFLFLFGVFSMASAQENRKILDYKYLRTDSSYQAYSLSIDTLTKTYYVDFMANKNVKEISKIQLITTKTTTLKMHPAKNQINNDNEALTTFSFELSFKKIPVNKENCEATLRFITDQKNTYFDLPINTCLLK